jgi:hypothetical protein
LFYSFRDLFFQWNFLVQDSEVSKFRQFFIALSDNASCKKDGKGATADIISGLNFYCKIDKNSYTKKLPYQLNLTR